MDRFLALDNFVHVVETGSISGAAQRLAVAKSVVSRRLAELEAHLGVQLLRRTTRRLSLTDSGRAYYDHCVRILADLDEAEQAVSQAHGALRGVLRVAVPLTFGVLHLGPALNEFMAAHPELELDLDLNDRQVDLVQEGFDLAIRIAHLADSTLIARRLAPIRHVVCASPAYLARHGTPTRPADLADHACLVYSNDPDPYRWSCQDSQGRAHTVRITAKLRANNGNYLNQAALAGHGIVLTPSFIVYRAIEAGELIALLTDYTWPELEAYAVYPSTRHLSRRVRALVDFLVARFVDGPYWDHCLQGDSQRR